MWASMVSRRVQHVWQDFKILHPNQHGFRWQRGTHTAILHLLDQLEIANEGPPIHLTMWDIRRAFDSVPKWLQRLSWARLGLDYEDLEWFLNLDSTGQAYIRTPAFEASVSYTDPETHLKTPTPMLSSPHSTSFHPERGIGQGDTPSTLLFVAVFDILLTLLDSANIGTPHAYADDLAHIAPTLPAQQLQADLVSAFCLLTGLEIASAKVEAITLNGQHLLDSETLVVHDWHWEPHLVVQSNDSFWTRYLGVFLDRSACNKHYHMAKEKFQQACKFLLLRHAPPSVKKMVLTLCILPCIRYPAGLAPWTLQQYRDLDKIPYQLHKQIYGLRLTFPQALIYTPVAF
jgi:hypothetical protein